MITHDLQQGSDSWLQFRMQHHGASEAAAMLGLSKKTTRNELLKIKHSGTPKQFSDWVQENILDYGHEVEALARPLMEEILGEDLYPVTCSDGKKSASCDGLNMSETIGWEHKQWNKDLAEWVYAGSLPAEFMAQPQQCLMITGAEKWIFTVSDGTPDNFVSMDILPDQKWFDRIRAGWEQFDIDLANYVPQEEPPVIMPAPTLNLPAVSVQVQGSIALASNLHVFGDALRGFISLIPEKPSNDQEFADCKSAIGKLKSAEESLDAAEANAMGQIASFDEMRREKALLFELSRTTRLMIEKLVARRESEIKTEIMQGGKQSLFDHLAALNNGLGNNYMPVIVGDWNAAIKSKRTIASIQNAVDTLLADKKIEANAIANKIRANLVILDEIGGEHKFLFADKAQIVLKANDDLVLLIKSRIAEHTQGEANRAELLRARIAEEERVKAEALVRQEQVLAAQAQETIGQAEYVATPTNIQHVFTSANMPTLTLGKISTRLGFSVTADFLRGLGFAPAGKERASILYHESDFQNICRALMRHINQAMTKTQE